MLTLDTPAEKINKIGLQTAKKMHKLEIYTARNLLEHYPFRYDDYSRTVNISELQSGVRVNVQGILEFIQNKRTYRQKMSVTEGMIKDATGEMKVVWFNQPFIGGNLRVGDFISVSGLAQADYPAQGGQARWQMSSPEYEKIIGGKAVHTKGLVPVYHTTASLTNKQLRFLIKSVIKLADKMPDSLPDEVKKKYQLINKAEAICNVHFPESKAMLERAQRRLKFEELFSVQLAGQIKKLELQDQQAERIEFNEAKTKKFVDKLPFKLTAAQKKASWEIIQDLGRSAPMSRMLEGDVGSGKTVTVALAMLNAALNKKQSALLAPTEILANQHFDTLVKLFKGAGVRIGLITRSNRRITHNVERITQESKKVISKKEIISAIKDGKIDVVVGTHALIQEGVEFKNLALAVIDEQHRFGVEQRKALRDKSGSNKTAPHLLSMTATPIPRSLAQVVYGDLDLSIINEMPKGRKIIKTYLAPEEKRLGAYDFIKKQIAAGRQAFVICPLISPSDKLGVKSVEEEYEKLNKKIFKDLEIAYLHGRLKAKEKDEIMQKFIANKINILIATSVVEVGVDAPNASIMMIEGAERFGLAQLHQFRGRVGRSDQQSYCLLFTDSPSDKARNRLIAFSNSHDGFKLAEADLKMRGPGEVYGKMQSGWPDFKIATLEDAELLKETREAAKEIMDKEAAKYLMLFKQAKQGSDWVVG